MTVEVTGKHLAPRACHRPEDCKRIYEFHPKLYDPPARGVTIIESIRILSEEEESRPLPTPSLPTDGFLCSLPAGQRSEHSDADMHAGFSFIT